jgi:dimethylhistidine N-methyltransferase
MNPSHATLSETDLFRHDVLMGLSQSQKRLPSKYFYDAAGSALFDEITRLDEYYPTRTELAIMKVHVREMAECCGPECLLIELGAGSLLKVRLLLDAMEQPAGYVPVDVSAEHLSQSTRELEAEYPELEIHPLANDFTRPFRVPPLAARKRVVYFPGSTIGNFDPPDATRLMRYVARLVKPGGGLLLGVDLRKSTTILEAAYNDTRRGVTAAFNRNLLVRINRELEGNFDTGSFQHRAFYNQAEGRIEMHLVSRQAHQVRVAGHTFTFRAGESIHTENSYKYDPADLARRSSTWNMRLERTWTDRQGYFAVLYFTSNG